MSEAQTQTKRSKHTAPPAAVEPAPHAESEPMNDVVTVELREAGLSVDLPRKFHAGDVMTDAQSLITNTAYLRQFGNNQNANAKARAERYAAAKTEAEREANKPLTAADYLKIWLTYEPVVGGGARGTTIEKLRLDTAWRFWTGLVNVHNKAVQSGGEPVVAKAGRRSIAISARPRKGKDQSDDAFKAAADKFDAERLAFKHALLTHTVYGPQIERMVEAELAARKAEAAAGKPPGEEVAVADEALL